MNATQSSTSHMQRARPMKVTMRGVAQCIVLFTAIALVMPPIHSSPPEEPAPWVPFIEALGWGVLLDILVIQWFRPRHRAYALVEAVMYGMFTALVVVFAASAAWNMIVLGSGREPVLDSMAIFAAIVGSAVLLLTDALRRAMRN